MARLDKFMTKPKPQHLDKDNMSNGEHIKLSMGEEKLQSWLDKRFTHEKTKKGYKVELTRFVKAVYGDDVIPFRQGLNKIGEVIERYLNEQRDFVEDFRTYLLWANKHLSPRTIVSGAFVVKKFFSRHNREISKNEWDDLTTLLPPNVAITQDDILTKQQLRSMMHHLYITGQSLTLFLVSTGARIGESVQLKIENLDLDADPPFAKIRAEYTKGGLGKRTVWMSYEARDAIKEWLRIKDSKKKRAVGGYFARDMVFPFTYLNFAKMWNSALEKAGLDKRDPKTKHHVYHVHTLRKFFSTQMSDAGVQESLVHAWMGHKGYLDRAYKRYSQQKLGEIYRDHMAAVSIYVDDKEMQQTQVIITQEELEDYMANGWLFKATLPSGKIIVEGKPGQLRPTQIEPEKKETKPSYEEPKRRFQQPKPHIPQSEPNRPPLAMPKPHVSIKAIEQPNNPEPCHWCGKPSTEKWRYVQPNKPRTGQVFSLCKIHVKSVEDSEKWEKVNSNL